jgi:hypothetical protein
MPRKLSPAEFNIGEVRQLRRPIPLEDGSKATAGSTFVVISRKSVRKDKTFAWVYTLWSAAWKHKKPAPSNMTLTLVQGALKAHTRACTSPLRQSMSSSPNPAKGEASTSAYFGRVAGSVEHVR